jgi:hypothetical protein
MDIAQTASEALAIMDRDGWNKGYTTKPEKSDSPWDNSGKYAGWWRDYPAGSHCIGGAWNIAHHGDSGWRLYDLSYLEPLAEAVAAQYPQWAASVDWRREPGMFLAIWNNSDDVTEADVQSIFEKLAAG